MASIEASSAMTQEDDDKALRARNLRTGLILAGIVVVVFVSFIVRSWYMRGG
ncbi:MAG: cytochrome oxidase small assembly protein [Rhodocyclaceae bacterium]|nr:cytochrome oxidase small assembly protein [Rhodocyclaceae bacterium]